MREYFRWLITVAHLPLFVLLFALFSYGLYHNARSSVEYLHWTTHTHKVMEDINFTQARMFEADASFFRYAISKEERYLEVYNQEQGDVENSIYRLKRLTADNEEQQKNIAELEEQYKKRSEFRLNLVHQDLDTVRKESLNPVNNNVRKHVSGLFDRMIQEESRLLEERESGFIRTVAVTGVLICLLLTAVVGLICFIMGEMYNQKNVMKTLVSSL